jgi:putative hemolysin
MTETQKSKSNQAKKQVVVPESSSGHAENEVKSSESKPVQQIDIRKVFHEKSPGIARFLPGFVYRYLNSIFHLDWFNKFMEQHGDKDGMSFLKALFEEFNVKMTFVGEENLPENGRFLFVSNHPLGGFDGDMLIYMIRQHYPRVIVLVNDILMNLKNLAEFFVPINKHGGQARDNVRLLDETYRSDAQILSFPSGLVSRKIKGVVQDLEWQKSFIVKAVQYQRDVIPIHVSGHNTKRFYRVANFRKFFRIKWNLEMFFLPDESYKHRNKSFTFTIGKPIPYSTFDKSNKPIEWAALMRELCYRLPVEDNPTLPGAE